MKLEWRDTGEWGSAFAIGAENVYSIDHIDGKGFSAWVDDVFRFLTSDMEKAKRFCEELESQKGSE